MPTSDPIPAEQFRRILEVSRLLAVTTELDTLLQRLAEAACGLLGCERASIFIHDPSRDQLVSRVALQSAEIRVPAGLGIVGHVFRNNAILHVASPYDDPRFNPEPDRASGFVTRDLLTAPMVNLSRKPVGVIQAVNKHAGGFQPVDEALLQLLADQAGVAIQRYRLQQAAIEATSLRREMDLASAVQQAMLPKEPLALEGMEAAGYTKPASVTGGDCFDYWQTADGRLAIFLADASGHGLGPALVVSQVRTLVRMMADVEPDPHALLERITARLCEDLVAGRFVTAFLGLISPDGTLHYSAAGHGPTFLRRSPDAPVEQLAASSPPLGIVPDFAEPAPLPVRLQPGGTIVLVSDGILDALDKRGQAFESDRIVATITRSGDVSPKTLIDSLREGVGQWQDADDPGDDQTALAARYRGVWI